MKLWKNLDVAMKYAATFNGGTALEGSAAGSSTLHLKPKCQKTTWAPQEWLQISEVVLFAGITFVATVAVVLNALTFMLRVEKDAVISIGCKIVGEALSALFSMSLCKREMLSLQSRQDSSLLNQTMSSNNNVKEVVFMSEGCQTTNFSVEKRRLVANMTLIKGPSPSL